MNYKQGKKNTSMKIIKVYIFSALYLLKQFNGQSSRIHKFIVMFLTQMFPVPYFKRHFHKKFRR